MKTPLQLLLGLLLAVSANAEFRTWTRNDGKTADMELVSVGASGGGAMGEFKMRDGRKVNVAVSSFSVAMLLAFLLAVCVGLSQARFVGVDPHIVWQILPWGAVAGLAGARLYSLVWHLPQVLHGEIAWSSLGEVWYGGLIGGVAAAA